MNGRFKGWRTLFSRREKGTAAAVSKASPEFVAELRACRARDGELAAIRMLRGRRPELSVTDAAAFVRGL